VYAEVHDSLTLEIKKMKEEVVPQKESEMKKEVDRMEAVEKEFSDKEDAYEKLLHAETSMPSNPVDVELHIQERKEEILK
jgi:hypothetical protein